MTTLWNYVSGYVKIVVSGKKVEKFLSICMNRNISLWEIKRMKDDTLHLSSSITDFRKIRPVAKKANVKIHIRKKHGVSFLLYSFFQRKAFVFGLVILLLALVILPSFVWRVDIQGCMNVDPQKLRASLQKLGVQPGAWKFNLHTNDIVTNLMLEYDEISWAELIVRGTNVFVQVAERQIPPTLNMPKVPCNICAKMDGLIASVQVFQGEAKVKTGDTVKQGQILISGVFCDALDLSGKKDSNYGKILAKTWYEETTPFTTSITVEHPIGISFEEAEKLAIQTTRESITKRLPKDTDILKEIIQRLVDENGQKQIRFTMECLENIGQIVTNGVN